MNAKDKKTMSVRTLYGMVILAMVLSVSMTAYAAPSSPFLGQWRGTDPDGSEIRLAIAGRPDGPFQLTWTESYIGFCDGKAGIIRGTGWLNESNPNLLEADLHLECFTTGATLDFHLIWRYHTATSMLSNSWNGIVTIWHRPGGGQVQEPPALSLRVNYGHDWVESFYEGGHAAWITVNDSDGNVKATAELITEPKDFWGGETGFQTRLEDWNPAPPDIQPYDWVYGWVDNGASAQVQIGDISGMIDLNADSITGAINAPWFLDQQVEVECLPWGAPKPLDNVSFGMVVPDNNATYSCSWSGEWNILPYQDVGVGYSGPDGHWVANAFYASAPQIVASESGDWFWTTGFMPGLLDLAIYSSPEDVTPIWSGQQEADDSGFTFVGRDIHNQDLVEGNYLVVSDGVYPKGLILSKTSVTVFDTVNEIMSGVAPAGSEVWAAAGPMEWQQRIFVEADPETGEWLADFANIGFDITEDMRGWSYSSVYDGDGDANEGSTPPPASVPTMLAWIEWDVVEGLGWQIGDTVTLTIGDFSRDALVVPSSWDDTYGYVRFEIGADHDLVIGDTVILTDGTTQKELVIPSVEATWYDLGAKIITGIYDPAYGFWVNVNGMEPALTFDGSTWTATFSELGPNMWGDAAQIDGDGDEARATIKTPNPNLYALPDDNIILAQEWNIGVALDLKIYNAAGDEVYFDSKVVQPPSDVPWTVVVFDLGTTGFDLQPMHRIVLNQNGYMRELTVSSLRITGFNFANSKVIGIGDPGANIFVRINGEDVWNVVDEFGNWEISHPQLAPGVWGEAIQPDGIDGDETRDGFQAPFE